MMQSANALTTKSGMSMAPSAIRVCSRCSRSTAVCSSAVIGLSSHANSQVAVDLLDLVDVERFGRRTVDHGAARDVEPGAVALTHQRRRGEQTPGERARCGAARAEVVERIEAIVDA